uniref:NADH-ubiquinone oxidoreductase chain 6 n=1 Tax=Anoplistes halodendri TaxID=993115 RepID=A0A7H1DNQ1_9CUCU|nr:NADH dehydrogenase subunit 6 [Anoplistes halodendri]QNS38609.1 NADH dehydrogenase subunit 6 [Anoplistes halodendri]
MLKIILSLTATLALLFMFMNHPLSFGLILLIETLLIALITGMMNFNFWFSYILFLVMVGGMLVLFIYMTSVASNEKFKFSSKLFIMTMLFLFSMAVYISMTDSLMISEDLFSSELKQWTEENKSMNKYMNFPMSNLLFLIISYLLIALIMVVKITDSKYGPLRQKF